MNRTVSDILSQSAQQSIPQVRRIRAAIIDVLFPSRSFVVLRAGYGRQVVPADSSIDFGTYARPLVGAGNFVWIELNESDGTWHATKYEANATCTPTTLPNAPNVPLTTYKPPQNTAITFEPARVDTNFFPHVASIGLLAPASKSPPQTITGIGAKLIYYGLDTTGGLYAAKYKPQGSLLFMGSGAALKVYNIGDPLSSQFVCTGYTGTNAIRGVRVLGNYVYILDYVTSGNFRILDATDPYNMILVYSFALPSNLTIRSFDMATSGTAYYFTWSTFSPNNTYLYSMSSPTGPLTLLTTIADGGAVSPDGGSQFIAGSQLAVTERFASPPTFKLYVNNGATLRGSVSLGTVNPVIVTGINTTQSRSANQNPESVWYIADPSTGLITVVDASNAASPVVAGTFQGDNVLVPNIGTNSYNIDSLLAYGGYLFVGADWVDSGTAAGALTMFDLTNKLVPKQVSRDVLGAWNVSDSPSAMFGYGPYVYAISSASGGLFAYSFT